MNPTEEQLAILDKVVDDSSNIMINALAGTGKTTTLEMIERRINTRPILYLCFNSKNAKDAEQRVLSTTTVRTFNAIGHRIWAKHIGVNLNVNPKKTQTILRDLINEVPRKDQSAMWDSYWEVVHGVSMAKALGYLPEGKYTQAKRLIERHKFHSELDGEPDDLVSDLIDTVLCRSIKASFEGKIDYNDQIFMPALFGGVFPQFPVIQVDEYQDLNPTNHELLNQLVKHRIVGVGDPQQNIYRFRGAKSQGMAEAVEKFKMQELDLSISFRCPQAIVEAARWRVPHFQWVKEGGYVECLERLPSSGIPEGATILCRNNAPLFGAAFNLLSSGRSVSVAGSDIGPKLIGLIKKLGPEDLSRSATLSAIEDWRADKKDRGSQTADDLADCMKVFAEHGTSLGSTIAYAEHVLAQKGTIRLMTIHKAKGLEFETVFHLDPWLCRDSEQDQNLRYVGITRSMDRYYEINSRDIQWQV